MTQNSETEISISEDDIEEWYDSENEVEDDKPETADDLAAKYSDTQLRVVRSTMDFTLHTLRSALGDANYINIAPSYQRRGRWDKKKRSLLIESFLLNVPVPPLFLFEIDYNQYEVMDGRQRLETISDFIENKFSLTGLEFWPELRGKKFSDLPSVIKRGLLRRSLSAVVLLAESAVGSSDFDIRMVLFRRLNTGGIRLNPQELRNALYPGPFNQMIMELSRGDLFTKLWRIPQRNQSQPDEENSDLLKNPLYKSMMDCELVLRFFAIRETVSGQRRGSLRSILDTTMRVNAEAPDSQVQAQAELFERTLERVTKALGFDFIKLPGQKRRLSRPLWDALMVAASNLEDIDLESKKKDIDERLSRAISDPDSYDTLVGRGNTVEAIKDRVSIATKIIAE